MFIHLCTCILIFYFVLPILLKIPLIGPFPILHNRRSKFGSRHEVTLRDAKNKPFDADVVVSDASTDMRRGLQWITAMQCLWKFMRNLVGSQFRQVRSLDLKKGATWCNNSFLLIPLPPFCSPRQHVIASWSLRSHFIARYRSLASWANPGPEHQDKLSDGIRMPDRMLEAKHCNICKNICQNTFGKGQIESQSLC